MSKAEKTRDYIIEKSAPIFNKKGYAGTSLADLIQATGLTKGSIYGNFENKDAVAAAVYHYNVSSVNRRIAHFIQDKKNAAERLFGITEFYRVNWRSIFEKGGCPLQNASVEADDNLLFLKKPVQESVRRWVRSIGNVIAQGQSQGLIRAAKDKEEYAFAIISMLEGGIMMGKIMNHHKYLFQALDRIDKIIKDELLISKK